MVLWMLDYCRQRRLWSDWADAQATLNLRRAHTHFVGFVKVSMRPVKTQISLGIRPVWSESSLSAWRKLGSLATHWVRSEDSDQTGRMPRLIWVFAGGTLILLVLSCLGSYVFLFFFKTSFSGYFEEFVAAEKIRRVHVFGDTVNFLNIRTTKKICYNHSKILTMRLYHRVMSKRCRRNSKQCRPWSDCSSSSLIWVCTVCLDLFVRKLRNITVIKG